MDNNKHGKCQVLLNYVTMKMSWFPNQILEHEETMFKLNCCLQQINDVEECYTIYFFLGIFEKCMKLQDSTHWTFLVLNYRYYTFYNIQRIRAMSPQFKLKQTEDKLKVLMQEKGNTAIFVSNC